MDKAIRILMSVAAVALLAACATTGVDANYQAYLQANAAAEQRQALQLSAISESAASCNGNETCVVAVAGFAALAAQAAGGQRGTVQTYQRQAGAAERIALATIGAVPGLAQVWATVEAGRNSVDIARVNASREAALAGHWAGAVDSVAGAFAGLPPSVNVGGDYITGSQHIGDAVGRDQIGGDQHIGDAIGGSVIGGDSIGRDAIGGDRIDNRGNLGDGNRITSPGPFDVGDRCTGANCQGLPPGEPPADPDPSPGG